MFKKKKGIKLSYYKQGLVYFICANFHSLPKRLKDKVSSVCSDVGGVDSEALFFLLTHPEVNVLGISMRYYITERKLYKLRNEFYKAFIKEII